MMETRYDRQLMLPDIGEVGQRRLAAAKVLLVGCGGLGSPVAAYLTAAGIGTLGLVDNDVVSLSNLNRQVLYGTKHIGQPKVMCARERLADLNDEVSIVAHHARLQADNARRIIEGYDMVVDGTDNFATRYLLSDTCAALRKPFVHGSVLGWQGQVSVLCVGHATYRDIFPEEDMPHPGMAVVGAAAAAVGSVQASQVLQLVCRGGSPLTDRLWTINLLTMRTYTIDL